MANTLTSAQSRFPWALPVFDIAAHVSVLLTASRLPLTIIVFALISTGHPGLGAAGIITVMAIDIIDGLVLRRSAVGTDRSLRLFRRCLDVSLDRLLILLCAFASLHLPMISRVFLTAVILREGALALVAGTCFVRTRTVLHPNRTSRAAMALSGLLFSAALVGYVIPLVVIAAYVGLSIVGVMAYVIRPEFE
jgi:phosphatidylglycerophosphate synthase